MNSTARAFLLGTLCLLLASAAAAATQAVGAAELAKLRAALAELPIGAATGTYPLQVLDWRTGAPLPAAVVVEFLDDVSLPVLGYAVESPASRQARWLRAARRLGTRLPLDADARVRLRGSPWFAVVVHGDGFALAVPGRTAPCPLLPIEVEVVDGAGHPQAGLVVGDGSTDPSGRATLWLDYQLLGASRFVVVAATSEYVGVDGLGRHQLPRVLPPNQALLDTRSPDAMKRPLRLVLPASGQIMVRGVDQGEAAQWVELRAWWPTPFVRSVGQLRRPRAAGAVLRGLPVGLPVTLADFQGTPTTVVLRADEMLRVDLPVDAGFRGVRYRFVDAHGTVLRSAPHNLAPQVYDPESGCGIFAAADAPVFARLWGRDGEEWSCAPFRLPVTERPGVVEGGDLVLQPGSTTPYCSGVVRDRQGRPVQTELRLTDGTGIWSSTVSGADGRFELRIGPWFSGPIGLGLPRVEGPKGMQVARGMRDLAIEVDPEGPKSSGVTGQLLGLPATCGFSPSLSVEAYDDEHGTLQCTTGMQDDGRFHVPLPPGSYTVKLVRHGGAPVLQARVTVGEGEQVAPAALRQPLPTGLRLATLRFVDAGGALCPLPGCDDASGRVCCVVPEGGAMVPALPMLPPLFVDGDRDVVVDLAVVTAEVRGLPTGGGWFFGLRAVGEESEAGALRQGGVGLLVARGVPLGVELVAQRYPGTGSLLSAPVVLGGFAGGFTVPAGSTAKVVFAAPADLAEQLQRLEAAGR